MSIEPFMMAIFCDDVRQEVGNKLSYLGIYGPNLIVPAFPTTLIKLCCVLTVRLPADAPPKSVIFRLLRDDEVVFEANLTPPDGAVETDALAGASGDSAASRCLNITTIAQLVSFQIPKQTPLKARALVDGKELRGGALELQSAVTPLTQ